MSGMLYQTIMTSKGSCDINGLRSMDECRRMPTIFLMDRGDHDESHECHEDSVVLVEWWHLYCYCCQQQRYAPSASAVPMPIASSVPTKVANFEPTQVDVLGMEYHRQQQIEEVSITDH